MTTHLVHPMSQILLGSNFYHPDSDSFWAFRLGQLGMEKLAPQVDWHEAPACPICTPFIIFYYTCLLILYSTPDSGVLLMSRIWQSSDSI